MSGLENIRGHWVYTRILDDNSNIVDLGANKGDFTRLMMEKVNGTFYIVEPNKLLIDGINLDRVKKANYAITSNDGPVKFYLSKNNEASSILENFEDRWGNDHVVNVEGVCWKTLINRLEFGSDKCIDILKVDIEGAELELIEQFDLYDLSKINQITVEFHDWLDKGLHSRTVAAIKKLNSLGYLSYCSSPSHDWPLEILFIKRSVMKMSALQKISLFMARQISFLKYH